MHGAWETNGPTNFQAPLYPSPADPSAADHFTVSESVQNWLAAGMPASKLVLGIPFYWRGWSGVPAGSDNGLYQPATSWSPTFSITQIGGVADYRELDEFGQAAAFYSAGREPEAEAAGRRAIDKGMDRLEPWLFLARLLNLPYFPLTPTFPWLGVAGLVPLPSKWYIEFGEPILTAHHGAKAADDSVVLFDLTDQVRDTIQSTLYRLLVQRRSVWR